MARQSAHGGGCCGAKHIYGFSSTARVDVGDLLASFDNIIKGQAVEIILNGTQVAAKPELLGEMARIGFVLDGHWHNGNHGAQVLPENPSEGQLGSHCYRFTRMDRRKDLLSGPLQGLWNGMVMTPGLTGLLPPLGPQGSPRAHYTRPVPAGLPTVFVRGGGDEVTLPAGTTVRVTNRNSRRFGRDFTILRHYDGRYVFFDQGENVKFSLVRDSFEVLARSAAPLPRRPVVGDRVQYIGQTAYSGNWNNGEYATVTGVNWPNVSVTFDRTPEDLNRVIHARYFKMPTENIVPLMQPPVLAAIANQRHEEAEVFLAAAPNPAPAPEVVPAAPIILFRSYHNIYRDGRVGAGYDTYLLARDARGRDGRIDLREMLSDGTSRMVENVTE